MTAGRSGQVLGDQVEEALRGPLQALGLDVEAVEVTPAGKRRVLRVAVDRDGGVTMDDVADATRAVGVVLDDTDVMGEQPYTLEVTSRGVDRPLVLPRHWRRNTGRLVKVKTTDGTSFTGRVTDHDEDPDGGASLDVSGQPRRVAYAEVDRALVQVEFSRPDEPEPDLDDLHDDDTDDTDDTTDEGAGEPGPGTGPEQEEDH